MRCATPVLLLLFMALSACAPAPLKATTPAANPADVPQPLVAAGPNQNNLPAATQTPATQAPTTTGANRSPDSAANQQTLNNKLKLEIFNRCKEPMRVFVGGKDIGVIASGQKNSVALGVGNYDLYARSSKLEARNRVLLKQDSTWTLCSK